MISADARAVRKLRKALRDLTGAVLGFLQLLDVEMKLPPSVERGGRIAQLSNALEVANDSTRYNALGVDFRKDSPARKRREARIRL